MLGAAEMDFWRRAARRSRQRVTNEQIVEIMHATYTIVDEIKKQTIHVVRTCAVNASNSDSKASYELKTARKERIWKTQKKLGGRHGQNNAGKELGR